MDSIIKFLEAYWGYTLFGGVTIGTLVSFTIFQIKSLLKSKAQSQLVTDIMGDVDKLVDKLNASEEAKQQLIKEKAEQDRVQAVLFKSISYLVAASKLPNEDKIALQKDFVLLTQQIKEGTVVAAETIAKDTAETVVETATEIIEESLERTGNLLDKYTSKA